MIETDVCFWIYFIRVCNKCLIFSGKQINFFGKTLVNCFIRTLGTVHGSVVLKQKKQQCNLSKLSQNRFECFRKQNCTKFDNSLGLW